MHRLRSEDLSAEADAWEYDADGNIRIAGTSRLSRRARPTGRDPRRGLPGRPGRCQAWHEQRGRRLGLVIGIEQSAWSTVIVIPDLGQAQPAVFRPEVVVAGRDTKVLIDQIRTVGTAYVIGELVDYLSRDDMAQVEHGLSRYLRLLC